MPFNNNTGSLSTVPVQHLVDVGNTYAELEPVLNVGGLTQTVALKDRKARKATPYKVRPAQSDRLDRKVRVGQRATSAPQSSRQ